MPSKSVYIEFSNVGENEVARSGKKIAESCPEKRGREG